MRDRQRHQLVGLAAREAEHHPLVAGAEVVERVIAMCSSRSSSACSTPIAMSGDCSWIAVITPHVSPSSPNFASVYPTSVTVSRTIGGDVDLAVAR